MGAQQAGGAGLWGTESRAGCHSSNFPKPSPHPLATLWPKFPSSSNDHLIAGTVSGQTLGTTSGMQRRPRLAGCPRRQHKGCPAAVPPPGLLLGLYWTPPTLGKTAGCTQASPAPVLQGRQPRFSSETPPASARGQGRPHPSPHVRCRCRQSFPEISPRNLLRRSPESAPAPGLRRGREGRSGWASLSGLRTPLAQRAAPPGLRPPPLSSAPVLGALARGAPPESRPRSPPGLAPPSPRRPRGPAPGRASGGAPTPPPRPGQMRRPGAQTIAASGRRLQKQKRVLPGRPAPRPPPLVPGPSSLQPV